MTKFARSIMLIGFATAVLVQSNSGFANAPSGRYAIASGTVYDTKTKLTWQQAVPSTKYSWTNAGSYCGALSLGGVSGWRVPTRKELLTLFDVTQTAAPYIDATAFPSTPVGSGTVTAYFWTSTPALQTANYAFVLDFSGPMSTIGGQAMLSTQYVRCVR